MTIRAAGPSFASVALAVVALSAGALGSYLVRAETDPGDEPPIASHAASDAQADGVEQAGTQAVDATGRALVPPTHPIVPNVVPGWDTQSCALCHPAIGAEWAHSAHGLAWLDTVYQESLVGRRRPESCHGCHVPEPMHLKELGGKPAQRDPETENWDHGISCRSCHLGPEGTILGPWGEQQEAHTSVKHSTFDGEDPNTLCIACHRTSVGPVIGIAKDFEVAGLAGDGVTCVGCHMPAVKRSIALDDDDQPLPPREGRSHRLLGPRDPDFLAAGIARRVESGENGVRVVFSSDSGHRVPGLKGRRIVFELSLIGDTGEVVGEGQIEFNGRNALRLGTDQEVVLPGSGAALDVRGLHFAPGGPEEGVVFLEERLALP